MRREGMSLTKASKLTRTDPRTVRRHAGQGLRREGRRWSPKAYDRLPRAVNVLTAAGPVEFDLDSRQASIAAEHANAVQAYLNSGDERALRGLRRRSLQIGGHRFALPTDPAVIDRLAAGGELHYELFAR
jgi:hypothetical protein